MASITGQLAWWLDYSPMVCEIMAYPSAGDAVVFLTPLVIFACNTNEWITNFFQVLNV